MDNYVTQTRYDGNGQPYTVRVPAGTTSPAQQAPNTPQANQPATPPAVQTTAPVNKPTTNSFSTPVKPSAGLDDTSFLGVLNNLNSGLKQNNALVDQKNLIQKQLFDQPLTPEELQKLPPDVRSIVQGGNRDQMALQLQIINDSLQGRNNSVASSIQFLTTGYEQAQQRYSTDVQNVLNYAKALNAKPSDVMKALYPAEAARLGTQLDSLTAPLLTTTQLPGSSGSLDVTIPTGTIAAQTNNPLNIKYGDFAASVGGNDSGITATDGGSFASFSSPEDGLKAAMQLLQSPSYQNLTVDQAMKQWSNSGYGAEVSPSLNKNQKMSSLSDDQVKQLVTDMAQRESGATVSVPESDVVLNAQSLIDGSLPPSLLPGYGGGKARALAEAKRLDPKFDAAKAELQYQAAKRWTSGMNSPQMIKFQGLAGSVVNTIDEVKQKAQEMELSGVPKLNAVKLAAYIQTEGNSPKGQAASQYLAAVNTLKEEFANLANGGYAPTDAAWSLANSQINGNYGVDQLGASLNEVQRLINYRLSSIGSVQPVSPGSNTFGQLAPSGTSGGSTISKGRMSDKDFVEATLSSQGLKYDDVVKQGKSQLKKGEQLAINNETGEISAATKSDISSGKYTAL